MGSADVHDATPRSSRDVPVPWLTTCQPSGARDLHREQQEVAAEVRVPERGPSQVHAIRADQARRLAEAPGVLLLLRREGSVDEALVRQRAASRSAPI